MSQFFQKIVSVVNDIVQIAISLAKLAITGDAGEIDKYERDLMLHTAGTLEAGDSSSLIGELDPKKIQEKVSSLASAYKQISSSAKKVTKALSDYYENGSEEQKQTSAEGTGTAKTSEATDDHVATEETNPTGGVQEMTSERLIDGAGSTEQTGDFTVGGRSLGSSEDDETKKKSEPKVEQNLETDSKSTETNSEDVNTQVKEVSDSESNEVTVPESNAENVGTEEEMPSDQPPAEEASDAGEGWSFFGMVKNTVKSAASTLKNVVFGGSPAEGVTEGNENGEDETLQTLPGESETVQIVAGESETLPVVPGESEYLPTLPGESEHLPTLPGESEDLPTLPGESENLPTLPSDVAEAMDVDDELVSNEAKASPLGTTTTESSNTEHDVPLENGHHDDLHVDDQKLSVEPNAVSNVSGALENEDMAESSDSVEVTTPENHQENDPKEGKEEEKYSNSDFLPKGINSLKNIITKVIKVAGENEEALDSTTSSTIKGIGGLTNIISKVINDPNDEEASDSTTSSTLKGIGDLTKIISKVINVPSEKEEVPDSMASIGTPSTEDLTDDVKHLKDVADDGEASDSMASVGSKSTDDLPLGVTDIKNEPNKQEEAANPMGGSGHAVLDVPNEISPPINDIVTSGNVQLTQPDEMKREDETGVEELVGGGEAADEDDAPSVTGTATSFTESPNDFTPSTPRSQALTTSPQDNWKTEETRTPEDHEAADHSVSDSFKPAHRQAIEVTNRLQNKEQQSEPNKYVNVYSPQNLSHENPINLNKGPDFVLKHITPTGTANPPPPLESLSLEALVKKVLAPPPGSSSGDREVIPKQLEVVPSGTTQTATDCVPGTKSDSNKDIRVETTGEEATDNEHSTEGTTSFPQPREQGNRAVIPIPQLSIQAPPNGVASLKIVQGGDTAVFPGSVDNKMEVKKSQAQRPEDPNTVKVKTPSDGGWVFVNVLNSQPFVPNIIKPTGSDQIDHDKKRLGTQ